MSLCNEQHPEQDGWAGTKPAHPFGKHAHDPSGTYWDGEPMPTPASHRKNKGLMNEIVEATRARQAKSSDNVPWISQNHPETSQQTLAMYIGKTGTLREMVYNAIDGRGVEGATDDELEIELARSHQSVSGARNTLMKDGLLEDSGLRRTTRYGNPAIVWYIAGSNPGA